LIKISHENLGAIAREHFEGLKEKVKIPKDDLEEIILAKPDKLEKIAEKYAHYADKFEGKYKAFSRKNTKYGAYNLAKKLQVNVCPYCNENPTYTIDEETKITRPEFDHFYDKATFPVLSLSFYNLIPCCHICNSTLKGSTEFSISTHIHPYSNSFDKEAKFKLKIEDTTFYHSVDGFKLELKFDDKRAENSAEVFKIQERYKQHKDLILELIQKQEMYPESYIDELLTNYEGTLFKNREDLLRLVTCGYITDEEIGKRPLSKLIKDISKELDLL
jgi:hypothetical protein